MTAGQVSLFGGADPADTPDADRCPACGGPTTTGAECHTCRARGHRAGHLELGAVDPLTTCNACDAAPMAPGQESPSEPGYCASCLGSVADVSADGSRFVAPAPDPHACPDCGGASRGFMLMTGHRQRECIDCRKTWLY